jgi:hypothetical protein
VGGLAPVVTVVEHIAGECLSSAFSLWAHRMVWEYLTAGDRDDGQDDRRDTAALGRELAAGRSVGSTAMAPALRDVAGLEPVPVRARRTSAGLVLSGPIRWASNLFDDAVVVLPCGWTTVPGARWCGSGRPMRGSASRPGPSCSRSTARRPVR